VASPDDAPSRDSADVARERVAVPPGPTEIASPRRRWIPIAAAAAGLLIVSGVVAVVALRSSDQQPTEQQRTERASSPFDAGLLAAASPYFPSEQCREPTPEEAPLAVQLPLTEVIKCGGTGTYTAVFWCTDTESNFAESRRRYLALATDTPIDITSTPAGQDTVTDGVQKAFHHADGDAARVYWDSLSSLCGAELQSTNTDVGAAVNFWHNGAP
jgi:hypothetical protein